MHRAHDVGAVRTDRVGIRAPNQRLRRQMKNDFRRELAHRGFELGIIANVATNIFNNVAYGSQIEQAGFGAGVEGVSANLRSQLTQPKREPTSLEAGVPGKKNTTPSHVSPCLPGCPPLGPQLFQPLFIAQSIHRLPESAVPKCMHLALRGQAVHRLPFKQPRIIVNFVQHFR